MVRKLLKYEFKYYLRIMVFFLPVVIAMGLLVRVIQFFDIDFNIPYNLDELFYNITFASSVILLVISFVAAALFIIILIIVRFYKNFYSSEGYLTFTLPVANWKLLFVKLFTAVVCYLLTLLTIVISFVLAFATTKEFFDVMKLMGNEAYKLYFELALDTIPFEEKLKFIINVPIFIVYYIIIVFLTGTSTILLYYICISIGQLVNKGRILLSIGVYYGIITVTEIVTSSLNFIVNMFSSIFLRINNGELLIKVAQFIVNNFYTFGHIIFILTILLIIGGIALQYFLIVRIMTKKLNLE